MSRAIPIGAAALALAGGVAHAACTSYPNVLTNGSTADATQVMADFNCAALTGAAHFTGNVGIGTATPPDQLDVYSNTASPTLGVIGDGFSPSVTVTKYSNDTVASFFQLAKARGSFASPLAVKGGDVIANVAGEGYDGSSFLTLASIKSIVDTYTGPTNLSGDLLFFTRPDGAGAALTERMRVTKTGNVGIGTTTPAYTLFVAGQAGGTTPWASTSDARLKTDVTEITDGLSRVERLRGVRFEWRAPEDRDVGKSLALPTGESDIGFVAQEVAEVAPEAVVAPKDASDVYSVKETKIIPLLVEAIKAQQAEIRAQEAEIADLKLRMAMIDQH